MSNQMCSSGKSSATLKKPLSEQLFFRNLCGNLSAIRARLLSESYQKPEANFSQLSRTTLLQPRGQQLLRLLRVTLVPSFGRTESRQWKRAKWSDDVPELVRTTKLPRIIMDSASRIHEDERSCG